MVSKNKIILIGNGFDLSHGLETGFSHFASYLIKDVIIPKIISDHGYSNDFLDNNTCRILKGLGTFNTHSRNDFYASLWKSAYTNKLDEVQSFLSSFTDQIHLLLSNKFLGKLFKGDYNNWFDIENAYFFELKEIKKQINKSKLIDVKKSLNTLNNDFIVIKKELIKYLENIEIKRQDEVQRFLNNIINGVKNVYIINFNYTNTIEFYLKNYLASQSITVNYIHGKLEDKNIIFGYGNDQNPEYQEIKNLEIDEFLEHFKTFEYQIRNNYSQLYSQSLDFFDKYEVHVVGHSLASPDKTLLDEIINSDKCQKVFLYKRKDLINKPSEVLKSFNKLLYASSRIMINEKDSRKKIVNFKNSAFFPL